MNKIMTIIASFFLASSLFSAQAIREQSLQQKSEQVEQSAYQQGYELNNNQVFSGYNAPGCIDSRGDWDWWFDVHFLWWHAYQENMSLAQPIEQQTSQGISLITFRDEIKYINFHWDPGFKVGLGLHMNHDNWLIFLNYLRYHTSTSKDVVNDDRMYTSDYFYRNSSIERVYAKYKIGMDNVDLELSRPFYNGLRLILTPHLGLRLSVINQEFDGFEDYPYDNHNYRLYSKLKSDGLGVGPILGLNGKLLLGKGLHLLAKADISILATHYKLKYFLTDIGKTQTRQQQIYTRIDSHNSYNYLRPMLETMLGLGWGSYYLQDRYHIELAAGWDFNVYWNQNILREYACEMNYRIAPNYGDFYTQGLRILIKFDF